MKWLDKIAQTGVISLAGQTSRRSFLARLGVGIAGSAILPLLPVARFSEAQAQDSGGSAPGAGKDWNNPMSCDYWAYCGIDGWLCSCCGGTANACPPGSQASPIAWVGTCINPGDGKAYVLSYNDCCGMTGCQRCFCNRNEGDTPRYRPQKANSVTWCYGGVSPTYHCTISRVLSLAQ